MKKSILVLISIISFYLNGYSQIPSYVPKDSLLGWWPLDGDGKDVSGNSNDATLYYTTFTEDRNGKWNSAVNIVTKINNGIQNGQIEIPFLKEINNHTEFSFSGWFKSHLGSQGGCLFSHGWVARGSLDSNSGIEVTINEFGQVEIAQLGGWSDKCSTKFNTNQLYWNQITITFSSKNPQELFWKIYLNGKLIKQFGNINNPSIISARDDVTQNKSFMKSWIGITYEYWGNASNRFNGAVDDIGIWNRALTSNEISQIYSGNSCDKNVKVEIYPSDSLFNTNDTLYIKSSCSDSTLTPTWECKLDDLNWQRINNSNKYKIVDKVLNLRGIEWYNHKQSFRVKYSSEFCDYTSSLATINVLDSCIFIFTDTIYKSVDDTLTINFALNNTNSKIHGIKLFPNPTNDFLYLDLGDYKLIENYNIEINDISGKLVFSQKCNNALISVDLSSWTGKGVYVFKLIDNKGKVINTKKVVLY